MSDPYLNCDLCGDQCACRAFRDKYEALKETVETQRTQIAEYQLAVRVTDKCCGCLKSKDRFKTLDRGTPLPLCENCGREACGCEPIV